MGPLLPTQAQQGLSVLLAFGKFGDPLVYDAFRQLILLHLFDNTQGCR